MDTRERLIEIVEADLGETEPFAWVAVERAADQILSEFDLIPKGDLDRLRSAIKVEGPQPGYHRTQIYRLARDWPTLWWAIKGVI